MGKIISFINYKGGVGKTTTTFHIGCALALFHNKKVLLVDVDPQTNLTFLCAVPDRWDAFKKEHGTIAKLFESYLKDDFDASRVEDIIWKSPIELVVKGKVTREPVKNLDLIPSDLDLLCVDIELAAKTWRTIESGFFQEQMLIFNRSMKRLKDAFGLNTSNDIRDALFYIEQRTVLAKALSAVKDAYDYILLDCPPNLYLVTQNALAASDAYIIATIPDHMSTIGIHILMGKTRELNNALRQKCLLTGARPCETIPKGILFTLVRTAGPGMVSAYKDKIDELSRKYGSVCFENFVSWRVGYTEASAQAAPVFLMNDENARQVSGQYQEVAKEFLRKMGDA